MARIAGLGIAVFGSRMGSLAGGFVPVVPVDGTGPVTCGVDGVDGAEVVGGRAGGRMTKHAGPALRWLACAAVGLPVVLT